ncbi:RAP domain-containing protein [Endozoicomonas sp. GU-1]|uniref:RAP domain-containing protein n=1 Tax=Endozoicomonas sp. GU-1 TaxID=3009078 RepID=UPI0022B346A6|nr:RAP domain-containing protein [Endozoicomonas sp. GU-1]WBA82126.1 RAP domain-containing protein [Endozoicomonas sp. GU-1]WBA85068.1 RAP domain-containing protein [Endozoicomonas sp. GU-1]
MIINNLLWSLAKLGEAIELSMVKSTFDALVDRISESPQFSQQGILMSLWGVMVFCARFYLYDGNKSALEKHIGDLLARLENTFPIDTEDASIVAMATSWLGRACPVVPHYPTIISQPQSNFRDQLQSSLPSLKIEEEKSLNSLPPVDLLLPDYNLVIDIQGPYHYVSGDFKTRNGSTLLKIALLQKSGFEVIEIPVNKLVNQKSIKTVIEQVKTKLTALPEARGFVSFNRDEESADEAYFTAEEYLEEPTDKPKRKKNRRKAGKTYLHKH